MFLIKYGGLLPQFFSLTTDWYLSGKYQCQLSISYCSNTSFPSQNTYISQVCICVALTFISLPHSMDTQEGVRNLHRPNDLVGSVQHLLYKVKLSDTFNPKLKLSQVDFSSHYQAVFHGGLKSMWSSVMELPSGQVLAI